jgi:hypothetical protein
MNGGVNMRFYFVRSLVPMGVHSDADVSLLPPAPNSPNSSDLTRSPRVSQTSRKAGVLRSPCESCGYDLVDTYPPGGARMRLD